MTTLEPQYSHPMPRNVFLSAAPGSGKSALQARWLASAPQPKQHLALTPDDAAPAFFLHRLLSPWPEVKARFEQLQARLPGSATGAVLGLALSEVAPDCCLLIDDFHVAEGTELEPMLHALVRHFPATGALGISSRHQAPRLDRPGLEVWGAEHPAWRGSARAQDLEDLPAALLAQVLALHVVGEFAALPDTDELQRRNLAHRGADDLLVLYPNWREACEQALKREVPGAVWEHVAAGLQAHSQRHHQTFKDVAGRQAALKVPPHVRQRHGYFLRQEGKTLFEAGRLEGGWAHYRKALDCYVERPLDRIETLIEMATHASHQRDLPLFQSLLAELDSLAAMLSPVQRAQVLNLRGWEHWLVGATDEMRDRWEQVLAIPALGERGVHFEHYLALMALHITHNNHGLRLESARYAEQLLTLATEQNFERHLLDAYNARLRSQLLDPQGRWPIQSALDIPLRAFQAPSATPVLHFVSMLGSRAMRAQAYHAAHGYFSQMKTLAVRHNAAAFVQMSNMHLLESACSLGRYVEAKVRYDELSRLPLDNEQRCFVRITWACALAKQGKAAEATALLRTELAEQPLDDLRAGAQLLLDKLSGEPIAAPSVLSGLSLRRTFWHQAFDEDVWPSTLYCQAFGDLSIARNGDDTLRLSRHKALALLGYLVLNPEGIPSESLAEHLFGDPTELNLLHSAAHSLRQGLKKLDAGNLLEAAGGMYRLRWGEVPFCDLHEFDALYRKGRELENAGLTAGARLFFELSLAIASAPLFDNLPDAFDSARAAHAGKLRHARAYIERHPG